LISSLVTKILGERDTYISRQQGDLISILVTLLFLY
jgi:hypothetical protein